MNFFIGKKFSMFSKNKFKFYLFFLPFSIFFSKSHKKNRILGTDDEAHDYEYLNEWGPRFDKLANMYGPEREHTDLDAL